MAGAVTPLLKELLNKIRCYNDDPYQEQDLKRSVCDAFKHLMDHLMNMIQESPDTQTRILIYQMHCEMDRIYACDFGSLSDDMIYRHCEKLVEINYGLKSNMEREETVFGFDDEVQTLLDQFTSTCTKQLQVHSITGLAGLGKTTLARKLFKDPLIEYMFEFRAWICVSQTYLKRDLLLIILSSLINGFTDETCELSDEQLGEKLYSRLKGCRYLVVLDDMRDCMIWNDLRIYFPDDNLGSRVLLTSRNIELRLHVIAPKRTLVLRHRTEDESWEIFLMKVSRTGVCPPWLEEDAHVMIRNCEGFPPTIATTADHYLAQIFSDTWLHQTSERQHSFMLGDQRHLFMVGDPSHYMYSNSMIKDNSTTNPVTRLLKDLLSCLHDYNGLKHGDQSFKKILEKRKVVVTSFNKMMLHIRSMMKGYVNDEVMVLFNEMEVAVARLLVSSVCDVMIFQNCEKLLDIRYGSNVEREETIVSFDTEIETLLDQLTTTSTKKLQVLSIAGMASLGKTTLAKRLYNDKLIEYMFGFRAWICVSQTYLKKDVLLGILSSFINNLTHETYEMSDEQLGEKLYRLLKGRKYLVVLDDMWDPKAWNDLRIYFPDDKVGSRVMFTCCDSELSSHVQEAKPAHVLRLRTEEESRAIFFKILFRTGVCPPWLEEHANVIIRKCEGFPLAIDTAAYLLENNYSDTWWLQTSESLHSFMLHDPSHHMDSNLLIKESYMARTVSPLLKKLLSCIPDYNNYWSLNQKKLNKRKVLETFFNYLMVLLRSMMQGYMNHEVSVLFEEFEVEVAYSLDTSSLCDVNILKNCVKLLDIRYGSNAEGEDKVVGFDDEAQALLDQLTTTSTKNLQVFSIAGMAGLGKTTLARKLYTDPLIKYTFDFRAWICVSQTYVKRDLLLGILSSFNNDLTYETFEMSDEQLGQKLHRLLRGRTYLVVLDDIWDCMTWNDLRIYFPDDKVGSRVLFTSRDIELTLHVHAAKPAHVLRLRTEDESWAIFLKKVFRIGVCPPSLEEHGRVITRKCEGLPLAIVITAGLLKNNWSHTSWLEISKSLRSFMVHDSSQYMDSLALSYNHLPPYLRQCFVFVGVFPEDYDILVTKLIWLWIAQGFIHEIESGTLEDVAENFLMDLITRCLLMPSKKRADGHIKTCRIHDLLRDLCLKKAYEETFSQQSSRTITDMQHSMSLNPPEVHSSEFCYPFEFCELLQTGESYDTERYKTLRILDVESVLISLFPSDITQLVNLRYLAIQAHDGNPKASISRLVNLQMLIISSRKNILVPKTIWSMINLRHIHIKTGENLIEDPYLIQETEDGCPNELANLQTLSQVSPQSCQNIFSATPNLRQAKVNLNFQIYGHSSNFRN